MKQHDAFVLSTINENKKINVRDSIVFCWLFFQLTTNDFVYRLFPNFFIPSFAMAVTPVIVAWVCIFLSIRRKIILYRDNIVFIASVFSLLLGAIIGNKFLQDIVYSSGFFVLITSCIFLYTRKNLKSVFNYINITCIFCGMLVLFYAVLFSGTSYFELGSSYMAIGYSLSMFSLILFEYARVNQDILCKTVAIIFSVATLIFGNRGAFFVLIVYFVVVFLFPKQRKFSRKWIIAGILLVFLGILITLYFEQIISLISLIVQSIGVNSRSLDKLLTHSFVQSMGRNEIYEKALDIIESNPIGIRGPGYLTTVYISARYTNANAHNILLELVVEYGCILGIVLFTVFLSRIFKAVKLLRKSKTMEYSMAGCFLVQAIVQLSFSSTFYICNEFWLGLVILGVVSRREERSICKQ